MAHYLYEDVHYELPDGISNEEAISKIETHLGRRSTPVGPQVNIPVPETASPDAFGEKNWHLTPEQQTAAGYDKLGNKIKSGLSTIGNAIANPLQTQAKAYLNAKAGAENLASVVSNTAAMPLAAIGATVGKVAGNTPDWEQRFGELTNASTYEPKSPLGQEYAEKYVAPFFNNVITPMIGAHPTLAPTRFSEARVLKGAAKVADFKSKVNGIPTVPAEDPIKTVMSQIRGPSPEGVLKSDPTAPIRALYSDINAYESSPSVVAQRAIEARQAALEQEVARQGGLDFNAAERARREAAPTGFNDWQVNQAINESQQTHDFLSRAQQTEINDHPEGQPPFVGGQGGGVPGGGKDVGFRIDENGMPIRSDISMEAQNLQDPLQRNLWGDELPGKDPTGAIGITQALDNMPPGPERIAAIESLKSNSGWTEWDHILNNKQGGALHPEVFKEGYRALNKALSRLSDMPWVKERFPSYAYQSNPDGTPLILLHGSRKPFLDRPRAQYEGLHAGFASPATMKAALNGNSAWAQRHAKFISTDQMWNNTQDASTVYPVAIKKGNYPYIDKDYGSWDVTQLARNNSFALDLNYLSGRKHGYHITKEILEDWRTHEMNQFKGITEMSKDFSNLLKTQFGIDGFFYKNEYESPKRATNELSRVALNPNTGVRLGKLANKYDHPTSFVTWDDANMESIFGETSRDRQSTGYVNPVVKGRFGQGGAIDISAIHDAVDKFKQGLGSAREVFASFKGTFQPKIMENLMSDINDPKARSTVVLMSPQQFKDLAQKRTVINPGVWQTKIDSIKEGLKSEQGLETNPFLWVDDGVKPNSLKVVAHEGRHRTDVFQQQGIDLIPVEIRHQVRRWGEMDSWPKEIIGQEKEKYVPFPTPLSRSKQYWSGGKFGQGGAADTTPLHDLVDKVLGRSKPYEADKTPEDYLRSNIPGMGSAPIIAKPPTGEEMIARQIAVGVGPDKDVKLSPLFQSGSAHAGEKVIRTAPIIRDISRNFKYLTAMSSKAIRDFAQPVEKLYLGLSNNEREMLVHALLAEDEKNLRFTPEQLNSFGATPKMLETYNRFRQEMDRAWERQNAQRIEQGKSPLTRREAFVSSVWSGDYHIRINGKGETSAPLWYTQTHSAREARLAVEWLKDHFKDDPNVDASSIKFEFKPRQSFGDRTQAAIDVYHDIKEMFKDDEDIQKITSAMDKYLESRGMRAYGQQLHQVPVKIGVRGFEGDKPWKSDLENANNLMEANIRYIENSHKWAAQQEITRNIKEVFNNKEIMDGLPNLMSLAKAYYLKHLGVDTSLVGDLEKFVGDMVSRATDKVTKKLPNPVGNTLSLGSDFTKELTSGLKKAGYAGLLGFSRMYLYATPLQAIHGALAEFHELVNTGYAKGLDPGAFMKELLDGFGGGILANEAGISHANKPAYKWAIENDILRHSLMDEYSNLNKSKGMRAVSTVFDQSISRPDQLFRTPVFMTFAGLLERSGKFETREKAWERAGEITENIMVNMRRTEGPLLWDKFGSVGNAMSMMQQPLFNFYNQLSRFSRQPNKTPALTYIAAFAVLAGVYNMPGVRELDASLEGIKNFLSSSKDEISLELYHLLRDVSIKGFFMKHYEDSDKVGQILSHGGASAATGLDFSTRFNQQILDPSNPLGNISPMGQEVKEWVGAGRILKDPTNPNKWAQTGYQVLPPALKEILETSAPQFRTRIQPQDKNIIGYKNPNDLESNREFMQRSQRENEIRKWVGGRSLSEAQRLERGYMKRAVGARDAEALDNSTKLAFEAFALNNPSRVQSTLKLAQKFDPELSKFRSRIQDDLMASGMSPEDYEKTHLNSILAVSNFMRKNREYGVNQKPQ